MAVFYEAILRITLENLHDLVLLDAMLPGELGENLLEPDETGDPHAKQILADVRPGWNYHGT